MTNILPRDRAELIIAEHAAGKTVPQIAAEYGHSPQTVRSYALGHRAPGEFTAREDSFAPFAAYCRRRLEDDPHLPRRENQRLRPAPARADAPAVPAGSTPLPGRRGDHGLVPQTPCRR